MSHPPCPSCGQELHLTPKRKGKCKACGKAFLLNKNGMLFGPFVTEKQASDERSFRSLDFKLGVGLKGFRKLEAELERQSGFKPATGDVIWGLYQRAGPRHATDPALATEMAGFLADEGKDPTPLLSMAAEYTLRGLAKSGDTIRSDVVDIFATTCCEKCRKLDSKRVPIPKALETMPLPNPECTNTRNGVQFCTCVYEMVIDWMGLEPPPKGGVATPNGVVYPTQPWWDPEDEQTVIPPKKSKGLWGWLSDRVEIEW